MALSKNEKDHVKYLKARTKFKKDQQKAFGKKSAAKKKK